MDLLFRIQLSLFLSHVSRTQYQSGFGLLVDEQNDHITACISLAERFIDILTLTLAFFNETNLWAILKNFFDLFRAELVALDMLSSQSNPEINRSPRYYTVYTNRYERTPALLYGISRVARGDRA